MKGQDNKKMRSLYEQWLSSGQNVSKFAKAHGYSTSTFVYWVKKFQTSSTVVSKKNSGFSELIVDNPVYNKEALTVITYPCGIKIELHSIVSASYLRELAG